MPLFPLVRIPLQVDGNPRWPLPADYEDLTLDGQRQARVNAASQWMLPCASTSLKAMLFVGSVQFFDWWYLHPHQDVDWDPLFYDEAPLPYPVGHRLMLAQWATSRLSATVAPRGFAKSTLKAKTNLCQLLTKPAHSVVYVTSSDDNSDFMGQRLKTQIVSNRRIADDFAPFFPNGQLRPGRGESPFSTDFFTLGNGSWHQAISAESRQRGKRPSVYDLDDPEYDSKESTSMEVRRKYMQQLLFNIAIPMVLRRGSTLRWDGTFVSRQHYLWTAMQTKVDPNTGKLVAQDPRFNYWSRLFIDVIDERKDGTRRSAWPEMWPLTSKDADDMFAANPEQKRPVPISEMPDILGPAIFNAEMRGRPGASGENFFPVLEKDRHGYQIVRTDEKFATSAWESASTIEWKDIKGIQRSKPLAEFLRDNRVFMTVDTSYTHGPDSDFKACTVMAHTPENELFVLDTWGAQCQPNILKSRIFALADRWHARVVYVEVVKESRILFEELDTLVKQKASTMTETAWLPAIRPLKVGVTAKEEKIATLLPRFEFNLIKLPLDMASTPSWAHLYDQVAEFNPVARNGGLQHDDFLDTVSMSTLVLKGRPGSMERASTKPPSPMESIMEGRYTDEHGMPWMCHLGLEGFTPANLDELIRKRLDDPTTSPRPSLV